MKLLTVNKPILFILKKEQIALPFTVKRMLRYNKVILPSLVYCK